LKILGIDEAGRGPVLGPMVMVGFLIDEEKIPVLKKIGVKDSKLLTPEKREELYPQLLEIGKAFVRIVEPNQIDYYNLNSLERMTARDIVLEASPERVIIDAFERDLERRLNVEVEVIAEHKADLKYEVVGAASIVAKVLRDREIDKLKKIHGDIGSGYAHDEKTIAFVHKLIKSKEVLPPFVRKSWDTVRRVIENEEQVKLGDFL